MSGCTTPSIVDRGSLCSSSSRACVVCLCAFGQQESRVGIFFKRHSQSRGVGTSSCGSTCVAVETWRRGVLMTVAVDEKFARRIERRQDLWYLRPATVVNMRRAKRRTLRVWQYALEFKSKAERLRVLVAQAWQRCQLRCADRPGLRARV